MYNNELKSTALIKKRYLRVILDIQSIMGLIFN